MQEVVVELPPVQAPLLLPPPLLSPLQKMVPVGAALQAALKLLVVVVLPLLSPLQERKLVPVGAALQAALQLVVVVVLLLQLRLLLLLRQLAGLPSDASARQVQQRPLLRPQH